MTSKARHYGLRLADKRVSVTLGAKASLSGLQPGAVVLVELPA